MRRLLVLALIVAGLLLGLAATRWLTLPPPPRTENASGQFDAGRAKARLARVLGDEAPHPADSAASDAVRERLVGELRAMGLQPRIADRFACNKLHKASGGSCARVRNVAVTIGPPASAPHVLVNSHYDSVPVGPGASDAGLGVASMMEAAYLLKERSLVRQMTFLFNEGEELGLIGARAFLDSDPLSRNVDALINLEARGTTGPVNMFETSVPNAAAVRLFKDNVSNPVANSLAVSAYRLIPNYTDVNSFVEDRPDWVFLNFAPIGNETRYHSAGDNLAALDLATLQHMGDQLMGAGTALGTAATPDRARHRNDRMFMNIGTRWLFSASAISAPFAALVLLIALMGVAARTPSGERRTLLLPVATAIPLLLLVLLIPVAAAWLGLAGLGNMRQGQFWRAYPLATELAIYAGVIALGLAALAGMRRWSLPQLRTAWWLLFVMIGIGFSFAAPGAIVYFVLPPLIFWVGTLLARNWPTSESVAALVAAALLYVTLGAALGLIQDLINSGPLWVLALIGGILLMPWLIETRPLLEGWRRSQIAPATLAFALLAWLPAAVVPAYSADRQQQWTTQYVLEEGRSPVWSIVNDRKPLPERFNQFAQWEQKALPLGSRLRWVAPAPPVPAFAQPRLERIAQPRTGTGERVLRFRVRMNGADSLILRIDTSNALRAAGFNGRRVVFERGNKPPYTLTCTGRSCEGAIGELVTGPEPLEVQLIGTHWRLPATASQLVAERPRWARPQYLPDATILVSRMRV